MKNFSRETFILGLIVLNALCLGAEAIPEVAEHYSGELFWILAASQVIFVCEIAVRVAAHYPRLRTFFDDSWNRFDFAVVVASLLPAVGGVTLAARVLRLFRILRAVTVSDTLRAALDRRPSPGPLIIVLLIVGYVFALAGFHLFGESNASEWGSLDRAAGSVWRLIALYDARSLIAVTAAGSPVAVVYVALFYGVVGMLLVNTASGFIARARQREAGSR